MRNIIEIVKKFYIKGVEKKLLVIIINTWL